MVSLAAAVRVLLDAADHEAKALKDDFISTVSHELRTPLTSIRAFSEMLFDDPEIELAERRKFLGIVVAETQRLTRLIDQVLDLAKIESGNADWHSGEVDLRDVVRAATEAMEQLFKEREAAAAKGQ